MTSFRWTKISSFIPDLEGVSMRPEMKFPFAVKKNGLNWFSLQINSNKILFFCWYFHPLSLFYEIYPHAHIFFRMVSFWDRVWITFITRNEISFLSKQPQRNKSCNEFHFGVFYVNSYKRLNWLRTENISFCTK